MSGTKYDEGKLRFDLLPKDAIVQVVECLTRGAAEYGERNWEKGIPASRLEAALQRHLYRWSLRQDIDPKSKMSHLVHVATNAIMMLALETRFNKTFDDRPYLAAVAYSPTFEDFFERDLEEESFKSTEATVEQTVEEVRLELTGNLDGSE